MIVGVSRFVIAFPWICQPIVACLMDLDDITVVLPQNKDIMKLYYKISH